MMFSQRFAKAIATASKRMFAQSTFLLIDTRRTYMAVLCFVCSLIGGVLFAQEQEGGNWYKGNLHTHSLWSDGNDFPEMISKWYADRDYHFMAMTDHNILSKGEKWFNENALVNRGGEQALEKYLKAFGEDWVEIRTNDAGVREIRLKGLEEYRGKFEKPGEFLLMQSEEISDSVNGLPIHMNATNLVELLRPAGGSSVRDAMTNNLRAAEEQANKTGRKILVHLNHPNFGWAITAEDLAFVTMERFVEIYNGHPGVNQEGDDVHASVERIWDIANTIRIDQLKSPPLFGLGTDDSHKYHGKSGSTPGRGWIMVRAKELTADALISAINSGDFYSSSGVVLERVTYSPENKRIRIEIQPQGDEAYTTTFVGTLKNYEKSTKQHLDDEGNPVRATRIYSDDVGKVLATVEGNIADYQLTGEELYVRAIVTSSANHPNPSLKGQRKQAWTQPVGWESQILNTDK